MSVLTVDDEAKRAAARAQLRAAAADCLLLDRLVPMPHGWNGPASGAFAVRVEALRGRIEAVHAALTAAEQEL